MDAGGGATGTTAAGQPEAGGGGEAGMMTDTLPQAQSYAERALRCDFILQQENTLEILCQKVAEGETIKEIAKDWDVPHGRLSGWLLTNPERMTAWFNAQRIHSHTLVEEAVGIADNAEESKTGIAKARLRIDTRFETAAHHAKERYGAQDKGGGGTRVQVIVQRHPQPTLTLTAQSQEDPHGDHSGSVTDSVG